MRAVLQRVSRASVVVAGETVGAIERGFLVLLGVGHADTEADARWLAEKVAFLRVFEDEQGKMNLDLAAVGGAVLAVSQFTLYGDSKKGRRPSFIAAAPPEQGRALYEAFVLALKELGVPVQTGRFGASMLVELVNDGPVTLLLDTDEK
jgi:D-tyrosyl-tRNA(Tyr) deacylase